MELRIFTEPQQGARYDDLLRVALCAQDCGYGAFFRSDHYLAMGGAAGEPGPSDAWITLAGLARDTDSIRLGTLMTAATFRSPGPLAISVASVDQMSGGRVEFGFGAGWYAAEHEAYGLTLPPLKERFDRYAEQLEIITGLWSTPQGERFSFDGSYYMLRDSPALPKPEQHPMPPVLLGGMGRRRTPALAARFATEFNTPFVSLADARVQFERVDRACTEAGRNPEEIIRSASVVTCVGADDAEVARRAAAIGRDPVELKENGLAGTAAQVVQRLGEWAELGVRRVYLQILDLDDLDHVEFIAKEVAPQLR
ncbi:MAG: LLM class F420-dependent oxidoreductase [Sciscionella sp.]